MHLVIQHIDIIKLNNNILFKWQIAKNYRLDKHIDNQQKPKKKPAKGICVYTCHKVKG